MKNSFAKQFIFFFIVFLSNNMVFSQGKFEASGGVGLPEYFNIKIKYGGKLQIGTGFGLYTDQGYKKLFFSGDCYYHFAKSKKADLYTWYLNSGITYEPTNHTFNTEEKSLFFYSRSGRSFNFSKCMGIKVDLGFMLGTESTIVYGRGPAMYGRVISNTKDFHFYPAGSFSYFFRL